MEIITDPKNKILSNKTKEIEHINSEIKKLANNMFETMLNNNGIGLSANQVGHPLSLIVFTDPDYSKKYILINPKIINTSKSTCDMEEGCLSLPNIWGIVTRPEKISLEAKNIDGKKIKYKFKGILARIVQHELDHLSGILFTEKTKKIHKQPKQNNNEY